MESLRQMFKDVLLYSEAMLPPELAAYGTEVVAATAIIGFVVLLGECQAASYPKSSSHLVSEPDPSRLPCKNIYPMLITTGVVRLQQLSVFAVVTCKIIMGCLCDVNH